MVSFNKYTNKSNQKKLFVINIELHGSINKRRLTVGKIYAGLLMLENYRSYKQSLARYGDTRPVNIKPINSKLILDSFIFC